MCRKVRGICRDVRGWDGHEREIILYFMMFDVFNVYKIAGYGFLGWTGV